MFRYRILLLSLCTLAACEKPPAPPEPLRPVKTLRVGLESGDGALRLPGEVRARHETALGFRVGGKVTECAVNMGDAVRRGQALARLEPVDYELSAQSAAAGEAQARSSLILAENDLKRYRSLYEKHFVSAAALDQKQAAYDAALAGLDAARSSHAEQSRRVGYTTLSADGDGIVTSYDCNIGQVVSAGQPVMGLARSGEKEIAIHLPEAELPRFRASPRFTVSLNAVPGKTWTGTLRELAAAADPATRTYDARIAVKDADAAMQLGMSASVEAQSAATQIMRLPLAAVISRDGRPGAWVVDGGGTVHRVEIALGEIEGDSVRVASGLKNGDTVVIAGTSLLREGEKVRLLP